MKDQSADTIVKDTAGAAEIEGAHTGGAPAADTTTMLRHEPTEEVIAEEARKGYDLLLIGVEPAVAARGEIHENVARVAQAFEGPLAIAVARGPHLEEPAAASHLDILVPVTGTEYSRRGAEVALTLARASLGSVTALYVARKGRASGRRGGTPTSGQIGELAPTKKRSWAMPSDSAIDLACRFEPRFARTPMQKKPSCGN